jgi:hypothetical protein
MTIPSVRQALLSFMVLSPNYPTEEILAGVEDGLLRTKADKRLDYFLLLPRSKKS